jgi:hypothetical protein
MRNRIVIFHSKPLQMPLNGLDGNPELARRRPEAFPFNGGDLA